MAHTFCSYAMHAFNYCKLYNKEYLARKNSVHKNSVHNNNKFGTKSPRLITKNAEGVAVQGVLFSKTAQS